MTAKEKRDEELFYQAVPPAEGGPPLLLQERRTDRLQPRRPAPDDLHRLRHGVDLAQVRRGHQVLLPHRDGVVERTLERAALRAVQTPQVFDAQLLRAALQAAAESGEEVTDDCSAVERLGKGSPARRALPWAAGPPGSRPRCLR